MKITKKLILAFSLLIIILIGGIVINQIVTNKITNTYRILLSKINPAIKVFHQYESINKELHILTKSRIEGNDEITTINKFKGLNEVEFNYVLKELDLLKSNLPKDDENRILIEHIISKTNKLIHHSLKIDSLLISRKHKFENLEIAQYIYDSEIENLYTFLDIDIKQLIYNYNISFTKYNNDLSHTLKYTSRIILITGIIAIILGVIIAIQVILSISNQIYRLKNAALRITEGNFDEEIKIKGKNEFAELGNLFNTMSTELKKSFVEQEKQIEKIKEINKELEQFVYVASHDLQEPLRTVSSYVDLIKQTCYTKMDDRSLRFMNHIENASLRMKTLIMDLLDYSRIGREKKLEQVNCNTIVNDILLDFEFLIKETNATINIAKLPKVTGLKVELKQLFQNIISNGLKFRKKDTAPIIEVQVKNQKNDWLFSVKDNGIGMEAKHYERVFVIFQRLNNRQDYEGTGIGLSVCKKIIEMHQGKIWIESKLNQGTTFYFTISKELKNYEEI